MPFDEEEDSGPSEQSKKTGLKKVSNQKSIFDGKIKPPSQEDFEEMVQKKQDRKNGYKQKAADLAIKFRKTMEDKTLPENKNSFMKDIERDLLTDMINLAIEINSDQSETEGMGSLSWITLLMKTILAQRDKINILEYNVENLNKKINTLEVSLDKMKKSD
jgi:hypothetical protein